MSPLWKGILCSPNWVGLQVILLHDILLFTHTSYGHLELHIYLVAYFCVNSHPLESKYHKGSGHIFFVLFCFHFCTSRAGHRLNTEPVFIAGQMNKRWSGRMNIVKKWWIEWNQCMHACDSLFFCPDSLLLILQWGGRSGDGGGFTVNESPVSAIRSRWPSLSLVQVGFCYLQSRRVSYLCDILNCCKESTAGQARCSTVRAICEKSPFHQAT